MPILNLTAPTYLVQPAEKPKAALIILHEAFAVTPHIARTAESYAQEGFICLAPDLLARARQAEQPANPLWETIGPMPSLPVNQQGLDLFRHYMPQRPRESYLEEIDACADWLHQNHPTLKTGLLGYCFGGSMAYFTASQRPRFSACVGYYGGHLAELAATAQPSCPTLIHLAEHDRYIPLQPALESFKTHHPAAQVHVYDADHGFNRDDGITFNPAAAALARQRTLDFLNQYLK